MGAVRQGHSVKKSRQGDMAKDALSDRETSPPAKVLRQYIQRFPQASVLVVGDLAALTVAYALTYAIADRIAVLHSALSDGERYDEWRALRSGEKRIAVGARSAIFAPLPSLGVIVVDEEHEGSYKQSDAPRYHAREVAVVRAQLEGAICVLGSATPALESWTNALSGKYSLLELPARIAGRPQDYRHCRNAAGSVGDEQQRQRIEFAGPLLDIT